jgi:hypothetical protein
MSDGVVIERLKVPKAEVLYVEGLDPFVVPDQAAYERGMRVLFDYMRRLNQELFAQSKDPRRQLRGIERGYPVAGVADPGPASPRPAKTKPKQASGNWTQGD